MVVEDVEVEEEPDVLEKAEISRETHSPCPAPKLSHSPSHSPSPSPSPSLSLQMLLFRIPKTTSCLEPSKELLLLLPLIMLPLNYITVFFRGHVFLT